MRLARAIDPPALRAVGARAVSIAASFAMTILVARQLGVEAAGSFFVAYTSLVVIATFGRFGTDNLALKLCGGDTTDLRRDLRHGAIVAIAASIVGCTVVAITLALSGYALPGFDARFVLLVLSAAVAQAFSVIAGAVLRGRGRMVLGVLAELGSIHVFTIAALIAAGLIATPDVTTALIALTIGSWLTALWAVPAAVWSVPPSVEGAPHGTLRGYLAARWHQLVPMMGTSLLFQVLTWAPLYALTAMSSLAQVAYYTTATRLASFISLVPNLQVVYLAPAFARLFHTPDLPALNALAQRAVRQVAILLVIPVAVLIAFGGPIVGLFFGTEFAPAAAPLVVLVGSVFVIALVGQVNQLMLVCGLEKHALALNVALVIVWATAGLAFAAAFGSVGVAWLGAGVGVLYAVVAATLLVRLRGIRPFVWPGRAA